MQITDLLAQAGGVQSIARELGLSTAEAQSGAEALVPAILGGFKKQVQSEPGGLQGLGGMLSSLGGGGLLDQVLAPQPTNVAPGNEILGSIFGSKDVSREVAQGAAAQTGLDVSQLKRMLPMLAMAIAGFMAKQQPAATAAQGGAGGGFAGLMGRLLGSHGASGAAPSGIASMLDLDGDGNALDDILEMARKVTH